MTDQPRIAIVGLGYVGLPLAVALARAFDVVGFDVDGSRIAELGEAIDRTGEVTAERLKASSATFTADPAALAGTDIFVVTVPTPVDAARKPDLAPVLAATRTIAPFLDSARRPTVVYESTVYPGVTDDICGPELERVSGLKRGRDFRLGYSPERINPGDKVHTVDKITKVVAGEDAEVLDQLAALYGTITEGGVYRAASIKAAEAAKAIENAQRDINIAFVNEVAQICSLIDVSVWDVLAAARSKWNFLPFEPGLVGGHCIGVDPYYLAHLAKSLGHEPDVILAGRETNDSMAAWIAELLDKKVRAAAPARAGAIRTLVMGATFKENVPDTRNSGSMVLAEALAAHGHDVTIVDPIASSADLDREYGRTLGSLEDGPFDLVVAAVAHQAYRDMDGETLAGLLKPGGVLADLKNIFADRDLGPGVARWTL